MTLPKCTSELVSYVLKDWAQGVLLGAPLIYGTAWLELIRGHMVYTLALNVASLIALYLSTGVLNHLRKEVK